MRESWIKYAADSDFSIHNLPYGIFSAPGRKKRIGVAIGDYILDLKALAKSGELSSLKMTPDCLKKNKLNSFIKKGKSSWTELRAKLQSILSSENAPSNIKLFKEMYLVSMESATMHVPVRIGDYTDFYSSEDHATNVGKMFRDPANALLPNWKHIPVGYHGRASSILISGVDVHRPKGQTLPPGAEKPVFGPSKRMDFELEMAFITSDGPNLGNSLSTDQAKDCIFGFVVFNDWSARDIQKWEYVPLGPFLAKSFASSMSPWIVTTEALNPFKVAGPVQKPEVLDYLKYTGKEHYNVELKVDLETASGHTERISESNFKYMYWNPIQQLAHHTVNGCNIRAGDMMASGTISGPEKHEFGSMLELSWSGKNPLQLSNGESRTFIEDHDTVVMSAFAEKEGQRIGFGEVRSKILPAK